MSRSIVYNESSKSFHTVCRCAQTPRVNVLPITPPLVDLSRASPLDLFEQPARGFFQREENLTMIATDYSTYTLSQLFKARYWIDTRGGSLEEEIQKRCAHIRERTNGKLFAAAGSSGRFKPCGLIFGVTFLLFSVGPFVAIKFLDTINVINDVNGDIESLSGLWALLTLPVMVIVFLVGSMMDAERVVKWFNLAGRQDSSAGG